MKNVDLLLAFMLMFLGEILLLFGLLVLREDMERLHAENVLLEREIVEQKEEQDERIKFLTSEVDYFITGQWK